MNKPTSTRKHLASFCAGERDNGKALYQQNNSLKNEMCTSGPKAGNSGVVKLAGFYSCLLEWIGNDADQPKKKGRISSPTLWALARVNQCTGVSASDSLGGFSRRSLRNVSNANCTGRKSGAECEGFGFLTILQPSGSDLGFLRCSDLSLRPQASSTHAEKLALGLSAFSRSKLASISSMSSCGKRIPTREDLLFLFPVATTYRLFDLSGESTPYIKKQINKILDVAAHRNVRWVHTLSTAKAQVRHKTAKPRGALTPSGPLTTSVITSNEVAMSNRTTPPAGRASLSPNLFLWRFLALNRHDKKARPCRLSVEAATEREARLILAPHFILSLAARLPAREVRHA